MRWLEPTPKQTRIVHRFLLLPLTLNGETRWLEMAAITQEWYTTPIMFAGIAPHICAHWQDKGWA
jgi:hypothetical protein